MKSIQLITFLMAMVVAIPNMSFKGNETIKIGSSELLTFESKVVKNQVLLKWQTLLEEEINYFQVERFNKFKGSEVIEAKIPSKGSLQEIVEYQYTDEKPVIGESLYRLLFVNNKGNMQKSEWLMVNYEQEIWFDVMPSPTMDELTLYLSGVTDKMMVTLSDKDGKVLYTKKTDASVEDMKIDTEDLPTGVYYLSIASQSKTITRRIHINK